MIGVATEVTTSPDTAGSITGGVEAGMLDAADHGFAVSQQRVPKDRGTLLQSGVPPTVMDEGSVVWGYNAEYARPIEHGTRPFTPPLEPLLRWGRRVLGSEDAGAAAWQSIRETGIDAQPFVRPGIDAMRARLSATGLKTFIEARL